jgi:hypothetical protein
MEADSRTKVSVTAEAMRKAEAELIMALELVNPMQREARLAAIRNYGDCLIKHHNAIEEAKRNSRR